MLLEESVCYNQCILLAKLILIIVLIILLGDAYNFSQLFLFSEYILLAWISSYVDKFDEITVFSVLVCYEFDI